MPALTDIELRAAYERRKRDDWPPGFEVCIETEYYRRLIVCEAARKYRAFKPKPTRRVIPAVNLQPLSLDLKRRASGEKDDD